MRKLKSEVNTCCKALELPEQDGYGDFSSEEYNQDYY